LSVKEDSVKLLSEFGLTYYEAKVYISAVKLGIATASKIAKMAGIRREEVYRAVPKLEKIGLLERIMGRPVRVKALPLDEGLNTLFEIKEEESSTELRDLLSKKEEFLEQFDHDVRDDRSEEEQPHFVLFSEKDALSRKVASSITNAHKSIDFADSFENTFRFILSYGDALKAAKKKDVDVRILTEYPEDSGLIPEYLKKYVPKNSFVIRYSERLPSRYMLFDQKQAMITTSPGQTFSDGNCLWTNDPNLVGIIHRDFEEQLRESLDWRDLSVTLPQKLNRILKRLRPRDHVILIYDSVESKQSTLFAYIQDGLLHDEAAMYVCCEQTPDAIREGMNEFGIDVNEFENKGALMIVPYTSVYIRDGKFNLNDVMDSWSKAYYEAMAKGFKGMRVTGEMSCFIKHDLIEELLEYERALHTILDIPMTAICAYNSDILSEVENPIDVYSELVKAHGKVLFAGQEKIGKIEIRAG
jgi:sugar-specific transcriptional regulator TrmB/transcriptional regulator of met regulon